MMMTTPPPTPGQALTEADVKLLRKGDWLRSQNGTVGTFLSSGRGKIAIETRSGALGGLTITEAYDPASWTFLGRPDQDGWIAWSGGENPVPGVRVDVRFRDGEIRLNDQHSDKRWRHDPTIFLRFHIAAYRPHAPVSRPGDGVEGERDMSGETFAGFRVAAWRYRQADETDKVPHHYAEHWSTPGASAWGIQRLFTEDQLLAALTPPAEPVSRPAGEGETTQHTPRCWGRTSYSDEMAHCYCKPAGEGEREAVARLIPRWEICNGGVTEDFEVHADPAGEWVKYSDVEALLSPAAPASDVAGGVERDGLEGESVALMRPFWVSWWGEPGTFELHCPWWVSGERDDGMQSICAAVLAQDEFTARLSVQWAHDDKDAVIEWRFAEEKPKGWSPFSSRFKQADWMIWPEIVRPAAPDAPGQEAALIIRDRLRQIWEADTHLVYSGNPSELSHKEGPLAKLANEAVEALNRAFLIPDHLSTIPAQPSEGGAK